MIASLLMAAALGQAPPPADAAPTPAPVAAPVAADTAAPVATPPPVSGAPADDYGFVAWCRGALSGHMELYRLAEPEMARIQQAKLAQLSIGKPPAEVARLTATAKTDARHEAELDREQQKAGRDYLALYGRALEAAEGAGASRARGVEATGQGYRIWSAARAADGKDRMYAYLMWELPGRCETAAKTLETQSGLFGEAFKRAAAPAAPEVEPDAAPPAPAEAAPAPKDAPADDAPPPPPPPPPAPPPSQPAPGA